MKMIATDLEIETIITRICKGTIDLQPGFQRGEIWSQDKKKRLIDTIFRNWHVPAIHVIEDAETATFQVLDGQQRLTAIRDFAAGKLKIDGGIHPENDDIESLDGLTYETLPPIWRRKFDQFPIRFFRLIDFLPEEPGELFYRLNQPTSLTAAEQRNAYYGPARAQIKGLVNLYLECVGEEFSGFSNLRMAYDDILARVCCSMEYDSLTVKLTAGLLAERYRSTEEIHQNIITSVSNAIFCLSVSKQYTGFGIVKFNKATLYSWLWFIIKSSQLVPNGISGADLGAFIDRFETARSEGIFFWHLDFNLVSRETVVKLLEIYQDRASSRVADVSSVLSRHLVLSILYLDYVVSSQQEHYVNEYFQSIMACVNAINFEMSSLEEVFENYVQSQIFEQRIMP